MLVLAMLVGGWAALSVLYGVCSTLEDLDKGRLDPYPLDDDHPMDVCFGHVVARAWGLFSAPVFFPLFCFKQWRKGKGD